MSIKVISLEVVVCYLMLTLERVCHYNNKSQERDYAVRFAGGDWDTGCIHRFKTILVFPLLGLA